MSRMRKAMSTESILSPPRRPPAIPADKVLFVRARAAALLQVPPDLAQCTALRLWRFRGAGRGGKRNGARRISSGRGMR